MYLLQRFSLLLLLHSQRLDRGAFRLVGLLERYELFQQLSIIPWRHRDCELCRLKRPQVGFLVQLLRLQRRQGGYERAALLLQLLQGSLPQVDGCVVLCDST